MGAETELQGIIRLRADTSEAEKSIEAMTAKTLPAVKVARAVADAVTGAAKPTTHEGDPAKRHDGPYLRDDHEEEPKPRRAPHQPTEPKPPKPPKPQNIAESIADEIRTSLRGVLGRLGVVGRITGLAVAQHIKSVPAPPQASETPTDQPQPKPATRQERVEHRIRELFNMPKAEDARKQRVSDSIRGFLGMEKPKGDTAPGTQGQTTGGTAPVAKPGIIGSLTKWFSGLSIIGKVGVVAGVAAFAIGALVKATTYAAGKLIAFARDLAANASGPMAAAFAMFDVQLMLLKKKMGDALAPAINRLLKSLLQLIEAALPAIIAICEILADVLTLLFKALTPIVWIISLLARALMVLVHALEDACRAILSVIEWLLRKFAFFLGINPKADPPPAKPDPKLPRNAIQDLIDAITRNGQAPKPDAPATPAPSPPSTTSPGDTINSGGGTKTSRANTPNGESPSNTMPNQIFATTMPNLHDIIGRLQIKLEGQAEALGLELARNFGGAWQSGRTRGFAFKDTHGLFAFKGFGVHR